MSQLYTPGFVNEVLSRDLMDLAMGKADAAAQGRAARQLTYMLEREQRWHALEKTHLAYITLLERWLEDPACRPPRG